MTMVQFQLNRVRHTFAAGQKVRVSVAVLHCLLIGHRGWSGKQIR